MRPYPPAGERDRRTSRSLAVPIAALLVASLLPGPAAFPDAGAAEPPAVTLLSSGPDGGVRFRVRFGDPTWTETVLDGRPYAYPAWEHLTSLGPPGEPDLPAAVVRVALPPAAGDPADGIVVEAIRGTLRERSGVRFPPVPAWRSAGPDGGAILSWKEGEGFRGPPRPGAEVLSAGIERGLRIARIAVRPVRWDPATGTGTWSGTVTVTVTASAAGTPSRESPAGVDAVSRDAWTRSLVNPGDAARFLSARARSQPLPGGVPATWYGNAAGWLKIRIEENGVYALTPEALSGAGVPVATVDPRTFRLYAGPLVPDVFWSGNPWLGPDRWAAVHELPGFTAGFGDAGALEPVAIRVEGEGDGVFSGPDRIHFYALGPDNFRDRFGLPLDTAEDYFENPYTGETVYWLAWGGSFPDPPLRMEAVDAAPQGGAPVVSQGPARVHAEENRIYAPFLATYDRRWEEWFWDAVDSFSAGRQYFVDLPHLVFGSDMDFHMRLWGSNIPTREGTGDDRLHHVQVDVNDTPVGLFQWGGEFADTALTPQDVSGTVQASVQSRFVLRVPEVPSTDPTRYDQIYLTWIDVAYRRFLLVDGAPEELSIDPGTAGRTVRITSQPPLDMGVLDVTDFRNPRHLVNLSTADDGTRSTTDLAFDRPESAVLAVYPRSSPRTPAGLEMDAPPGPGSGPQWLRDTGEPLDYVILVPDGFEDAGELLAARRRAALPPVTPGRPGRVRVVALSDVMDEFAWGMRDPAAIRYFLEYAYRYYGAPGDDALAWCLLVGDHHYDARGRLGGGETSWMPSWEYNRSDLEGISLGNVQYASDDPLARFDSATDTITDLYLGRLPVDSEAQARAVIEDKIVRPEEEPLYGPWRARCLLVADDLCQRGQVDVYGLRFTDESEATDGILPRAFDRRKLYLVDYGESCSIQIKPDARADLIALWNEGAWLVNYVGHGNEAFLADERVLEIRDVPLLKNAGRLPLVVATASRSGKFNQPGQDGLIESLVASPGGGAVAATGSASNQTPAEFSFDLGRGIHARLFAGGDPLRPVPFGAAFMEAKRAAGPGSDIFTYFGDPATLPPVPGLGMTLSGPDSLVRGAFAGVGGTVAGGLGREGTAELRGEGTRIFRPLQTIGFDLPGELLFRGPFPVGADSAAMGFVVPAATAPGDDARVRAYAWGTGWDALGALDPLPLGGTADPSADTEGPVITFSPHPPEVAVGQTLEAAIEDMSGVKLGGAGVEVIVRDATGAEAVRIPATEMFLYDTGSHTRGTVQFAVPDVAFGAYTFEVSARDNYDNPASASTEAEVSATAGGVSLSDVYAWPNPFNPDRDPATAIVFTLNGLVDVKLRIYTVSGRLVYERTLAAGEVRNGRNRFDWDGRDRAGDAVANGVYLARISAGGDPPARHVERLVLVR